MYSDSISQGGGFAPTNPTGGADGGLSLFGQDISGLKTGSRSGLPEAWTQQLSPLIPQLVGSAQNYRSDIDKTTQAAKELYASQAKKAMRTGAQDILGRLSSRNMLDSSVASDTLSKGLTDIATSTAGKGFESALTGAAMKAQEPTMLGNLVNLGQTSESFDQLAPFKLLMNSYLGMQ